MITIREMMKTGGGVDEVAKAAGVAPRTARKWMQTGVPDWHWPALIERCDVTPDQIFEANKSLRAESIEGQKKRMRA